MALRFGLQYQIQAYRNFLSARGTVSQTLSYPLVHQHMCWHVGMGPIDKGATLGELRTIATGWARLQWCSYKGHLMFWEYTVHLTDSVLSQRSEHCIGGTPWQLN